MEQVEADFLHTYKLLDAVLRDAYQTDNGVGTYLAEMEEADAEGRRRVADWSEDYRMIKRLRRVRNSVSHDTDSGLVCGEEELEELEDFYRRVLHTEDPLALLHKSVTQDRTERRSDTPEQQDRLGRRAPRGLVIALLVLAVVCFALLVVLTLLPE